MKNFIVLAILLLSVTAYGQEAPPCLSCPGLFSGPSIFPQAPAAPAGPTLLVPFGQGRSFMYFGGPNNGSGMVQDLGNVWIVRPPSGPPSGPPYTIIIPGGRTQNLAPLFPLVMPPPERR